MKILLITIMLTIVFFPLVAQDEMLQRIDGENVEKIVYVMISHDNLKYKLDPGAIEYDDLGFLMKENDDLLFNARSGKVKLVFGFYNPYRYQIVVNQESSEDPMNESTEEFLKSFTSFLTVVTIGTPMPFKADEETKIKEATLAAFPSIGSKAAVTAAIVSSEAIQWMMWAQQYKDCSTLRTVDGNVNGDDGNPLGADANFSPQIAGIIEKMAQIESVVYGKFKIHTGDPQGLGAHFLSITKILYKSSIAKEYQDDVDVARKYYDALKEKVNGIKKALDELESIKEKLEFKSEYCQHFQAYTIHFLNQYIKEMTEKNTHISKMMTKLDEFIKTGETYIDDNYIRDQNGEYKNISYNEDLYSDYKNIRTVTITLKKLEPVASFEEIETAGFLKTKTEIKRSFKMVRFRRSWSEASAGLFYSNLIYLQYSTIEDANGNLVVGDPAEKKPRALVALFYNHVFNIQTYPLFPVLQFGLASGKEYPTILIGGGFRILSKDTKRFSITGGMALPFIQDLEDLSIGSEVSGQAEIDEDIRYRLTDKPGFYVGLAWKL